MTKKKKSNSEIRKQYTRNLGKWTEWLMHLCNTPDDVKKWSIVFFYDKREHNIGTYCM